MNLSGLWWQADRYRLSLLTPPTEEPVSLIEMRLHLKIDEDWTDEDTAIEGAITSARMEAESRTQRALCTSTWRLALDCFPCSEINLPIAPVQSITSIGYVDSSGVSQTLDPTKYVADLTGYQPVIAAAYSTYWPNGQAGSSGVVVTFVAGYGRSYDVPAPIRSWIKLRAADLFRNRESIVTYRGTVQDLSYVDRLLDPYRTSSVA